MPPFPRLDGAWGPWGVVARETHGRVCPLSYLVCPLSYLLPVGRPHVRAPLRLHGLRADLLGRRELGEAHRGRHGHLLHGHLVVRRLGAPPPVGLNGPESGTSSLGSDRFVSFYKARTLERAEKRRSVAYFGRLRVTRDILPSATSLLCCAPRALTPACRALQLLHLQDRLQRRWSSGPCTSSSRVPCTRSCGRLPRSTRSCGPPAAK